MIAVLSSIVILLGAVAGAPDLQVERAPRTPARLSGAPGHTIVFPVRLRNVGTAAAFAVVIRTLTRRGEAAPPSRMEPGPGPGEWIDRGVSLRAEEGMGEVCVDLKLQTLQAGDTPESELRNNRLCIPLDLSHGDATP